MLHSPHGTLFGNKSFPHFLVSNRKPSLFLPFILPSCLSLSLDSFSAGQHSTRFSRRASPSQSHATTLSPYDTTFCHAQHRNHNNGQASAISSPRRPDRNHATRSVRCYRRAEAVPSPASTEAQGEAVDDGTTTPTCQSSTSPSCFFPHESCD